jgi:hypothetical protein
MATPVTDIDVIVCGTNYSEFTATLVENLRDAINDGVLTPLDARIRRPWGDLHRCTLPALEPGKPSLRLGIWEYKSWGLRYPLPGGEAPYALVAANGARRDAERLFARPRDYSRSIFLAVVNGEFEDATVAASRLLALGKEYGCPMILVLVDTTDAFDREADVKSHRNINTSQLHRTFKSLGGIVLTNLVENLDKIGAQIRKQCLDLPALPALTEALAQHLGPHGTIFAAATADLAKFTGKVYPRHNMWDYRRIPSEFHRGDLRYILCDGEGFGQWPELQASGVLGGRFGRTKLWEALGQLERLGILIRTPGYVVETRWALAGCSAIVRGLAERGKASDVILKEDVERVLVDCEFGGHARGEGAEEAQKALVQVLVKLGLAHPAGPHERSDRPYHSFLHTTPGGQTHPIRTPDKRRLPGRSQYWDDFRLIPGCRDRPDPQWLDWLSGEGEPPMGTRIRMDVQLHGYAGTALGRLANDLTDSWRGADLSVEECRVNFPAGHGTVKMVARVARYCEQSPDVLIGHAHVAIQTAGWGLDMSRNCLQVGVVSDNAETAQRVFTNIQWQLRRVVALKLPQSADAIEWFCPATPDGWPTRSWEDRSSTDGLMSVGELKALVSDGDGVSSWQREKWPQADLDALAKTYIGRDIDDF